MPVTNVRPIAMGVSEIKIGAVGDGVPGASLTALPLPYKGSVAFNFADPKEVKVETEGSDDPLFVEFIKDTTDYIEFAIPSPANDTVKTLMGGELDTTNDLWKEAVSLPSISQTVQLTTLPKKGKKVVYTIVNGRISAKFSQAPGAEQSELLLVRVYKQAAISAAGVKGYAFSREVVAAS